VTGEYRSLMGLSTEFYSQTIAEVFQEQELLCGLLRHRDHLVDPPRSPTPPC